jgi:hypothetical protein
MSFDDERLGELVNLTADGQATAQQQAELQSLLQKSPEARELDASTRRIVARLDSVEPENPPAGLRPAVMDHVRASEHQATRPRPFSRRARFALGWAIAASVILVFLVVYNPGNSGDEASALMAPAAKWPVVATLNTEEDSVVIRQQEDRYAVEPHISGPYPVTVSVSWDPALASLVAISGGPEASSSTHNAEFTLRSAEDRASVMVRRLGEEPFEIRVAVAGSEIGRAEVPVD